ncbi:hypothetical protein Tco_1507674 [Tanacetum coccineum]
MNFMKLISQLEIHGEVISQEDANLKLLRSLPSAWNSIALIMRNKSDLDTLSMDDLYNNLKGNPQLLLTIKDFDSGCSRHMTRNKSFLIDYQEIDGGFVAFGGRETFKGIPSKLLFENDHTCVALSEGKATKASYTTKLVSSISHLTHVIMDLFGQQLMELRIKLNGKIAQVQRNIDARQAGKMTVSGPQYVLLPFFTSDSQGPKSSNDKVADDAGKQNEAQDPAKEGQEKDDPGRERAKGMRLKGVRTNKDIQWQQEIDGIIISQDKYVADILKKFDFSSVKTASTPIETNKALLKDEEAEDVDVHLYRSMIGSKRMLISWQCKKQTIVANSTTEAEYVATANCYGQNPVFHSKTKHIEIRHNFIRDSYEKKLIQDTQLPQTSVPIPNLADEAIFKEKDDIVLTDTGSQEAIGAIAQTGLREHLPGSCIRNNQRHVAQDMVLQKKVKRLEKH